MDGVGQLGAMGAMVGMPAGGMTPMGGPANTQLPSAVQQTAKGDSSQITVESAAMASSSTSISSRVESFMGTYGASTANNDILNLLILMAAMKVLQDDEKKGDKSGMAGLLMLALSAQQQQQQQGSEMYLYQSSSIEVSQSSAAYAGTSIQMQNAGQAAYGAVGGAAGQAGASGGVDFTA